MEKVSFFKEKNELHIYCGEFFAIFLVKDSQLKVAFHETGYDTFDELTLSQTEIDNIKEFFSQNTLNQKLYAYTVKHNSEGI